MHHILRTLNGRTRPKALGQGILPHKIPTPRERNLEAWHWAMSLGRAQNNSGIIRWSAYKGVHGVTKAQLLARSQGCLPFRALLFLEVVVDGVMGHEFLHPLNLLLLFGSVQ